MPLLPRLSSLLRNLAGKRRIEQELSDEVGSYVELLTQRKMRDGLTEGEARREALVEFGGVEQVRRRPRMPHRDCSACWLSPR